jgi:ketosteroid isomerase-like protein
MTTVGERWAHAIAARDAATLAGLLTEDVDFLGVTPRRAWDASTRAGVVDIVLGTWFDDGTSIDEVEELTTDRVADTERVGYRFRTTTADGPHVIEQQAYYRAKEGRIGYLRIVCSGYRPVG